MLSSGIFTMFIPSPFLSWNCTVSVLRVGILQIGLKQRHFRLFLNGIDVISFL